MSKLFHYCNILNNYYILKTPLHNMNWRLFGLTEQIKQIPKILSVVRNPIKFYQKNKDQEEKFLIFATLTTRLSLIIDLITKFIVGLFTATGLFATSQQMSMLLYIVLFIFAPVLAWLGIKIGGFFITLFTRAFAKKTDYLTAQRIVAYSSVAGLIPDLPLLGIVGVILYFIFETIGVSKQYNISYPLSAAIVIAPIVLILIFFFLFLILPFMLIGSSFTGEAIKWLW